MIKRLWLTIKFLFTGKVDGYISEHEALEMRVAVSNDADRYADRIIREARDNFWKILSSTSLKEIALINMKEINESISKLNKDIEHALRHNLMEFRDWCEEQKKTLEAFKSRIKHDIELLG